MATIKDVAVQANVSITTVSHVINGTRFVEPETQERVRLAITSLGYRPNSLARSLRRGQTSTIGLLVPDNSNPFFADVARAVEDAGFEQGYNVILCNSDMSESKEAAYINVLLSKQVDGVILISSANRPDLLQPLLAANVPVVVVDREIETPDLTLDQVLVDNEQGGYLAGEYLARLGHRQIACIVGPSGVTPSAARITGFRRALADHAIALKPEAVVGGDFRYGGGAAAMEELLSRHLKLTAVFAANDLMAIGAINTLRRYHILVPGDISVLGFDNILQASAMSPTVATIAQPIKELGQRSVSLLLERIKYPKRPASQVLLPTTLIERESCSPPGKEVHMKKTGVLNTQLATVIASMGHTDMLVIGDAGLPVPPGVLCIDLAVAAGLPGFLEVARAISTELEAEQLVIAEELQNQDGPIPDVLQGFFPNAKLHTVSHTELKALSAKARAVVRTGEYTPYANVIIYSGVVF